MSELTLRQRMHNAVTRLEEAQQALVLAQKERDEAREAVNALIHEADPL